jgi:hypothetical protein
MFFPRDLPPSPVLPGMCDSLRQQPSLPDPLYDGQVNVLQLIHFISLRRGFDFAKALTSFLVGEIRRCGWLHPDARIVGKRHQALRLRIGPDGRVGCGCRACSIRT